MSSLAQLLTGIKSDIEQGYGTEKETGEAFAQSGLERKDVWITTKGEHRSHSLPRLLHHVVNI
jgi:diketogulonate reductase-like aldo/keto reductase